MFDGVLGLPPSQFSDDGAKSVFQTAVDQGLVDEPVFTLWPKNDFVGKSTQTSIGK